MCNVISRSQNSYIDNMPYFICLVPANIICRAKGISLLYSSGKEKNTSYQVTAGSKVTESMTQMNEWRID